MDISFDSIISFVDMAINGFKSVYGVLSWTVGDYINTLFGWIPAIGKTIADTINVLYSNIVVNGVSLRDMSLLVILYGFGLMVYIVYQFCVWLLNLVT